MRLDVVIDLRLVCHADLGELHTHSQPPICPRHPGLDIDLVFSAGKAEAHSHGRIQSKGAGGSDRKATAADVDRQGRRDRVAETVRDRYAQGDTWARTPVRCVRKQVRQERREYVLDRCVLVDVAHDTQSLELAYLI